jgi:ribonuclease BN (tRNA processing enzyme)/energy-coupling factor transporter ATP-binding protein EcfA2
MHASIPCSPELIAARLAGAERRVLLCGESGIGKSTLAAGLAGVFAGSGRPCLGISADPGSPAFGVPGAVCLGRWEDAGWRLLALEAICTLDAGRFRLPLLSAVRRLAAGLPPAMVLVDAPGIVRGVAGAELLTGLIEAAAVDTVLVLCRDKTRLAVANELATCGREVLFVQPSARARLPRKRQRAGQRTRLWDAYLQAAPARSIPAPWPLLTGTPPPPEALHDWQGRQIALLQGGRTLALGEVLQVTPDVFQLRTAGGQEAAPDQYLVRDAYRDAQGRLATFKPAGGPEPRAVPPDVAPWPSPEKAGGPVPLVRLGDATAVLVNGVFGDPLLHLRLHNRRRSILFDLGDGVRLPARLAHQVTDVLISHAHIDHICGFLWLLRSRIGLLAPCRLFGPPGLAERIASLINGIHWDRIGEGGPRFAVTELHGDRLLAYQLQAGREGKIRLAARPAPEGLLLADADCRLRAVTLDHAGIPVLAYSLELPPKFNVHPERLGAAGLAPGPWLGELKRLLAAGDRQAPIGLPDGRNVAAGLLADELIRVTPARRLAYATDLGDSTANRDKLAGLARGASILFCEAAFLAADRPYAELSGHLTTRACGEIASTAGVAQLVPFHFSRRYEERPQQVYAEVQAAAPMISLRENA